MMHLERDSAGAKVDCTADPVGSLVDMFVDRVQAGRIARGQCPAMRPVFLKPHGVAHGFFRIRQDLPDDLKVGLFAGTEHPAWARFSSDTVPTASDFKTTVGIGIKLFDAPGQKIFGEPGDTTFDLILQNFDVFFVDTAADMCAFTRAGVIDGDYGPYLDAHPRTAQLLDEMAKPVASVLGTAYWSCVPFAFGPGRFVKYKLEPLTEAGAISEPPSDPTYLAADLRERLLSGEARFRFLVQFSTDPKDMPLDQATVRWEESVSEPIHVADLVLAQQDVTARGQAAYGENLSWNIWRVTEEHAPCGSIADARRAVYAASAAQRLDVNGVPRGEPDQAKPVLDPAPCVDQVIVRAAIHPAIGVVRIGDSETDYFIGPETLDPAPQEPGFYRDACGALKRQAARFRIFGYNAAGEVVRELTAANADIRWTAHLANRKAEWFQFQAALDLPEAASMKVPRRNPDVPSNKRSVLAIDPGPRSVAGANAGGGPEHRFDDGQFKGVKVPLGEIRTDDQGRLIVLGGRGKSASPSDAPVYDPSDPNSFNNADDWYDDTSDGPVTATVAVAGRVVPVEPAWVVVAPPNYGPDIVGWRTLDDLLTDVFVECGWLQMPDQVSFVGDVLPVLRRLANLQWVNQGFAAMFGKGCPMDFGSDAFIDKLATKPDPLTGRDPYRELRQRIFNCIRPSFPKVSEPERWPHAWPWLYGDTYGSFAADSPDNYLSLPSVKAVLLRRWVEGDFIDDWPATSAAPASIDQAPLAEQPALLDKAALHFCLADAFHPGCEMTWPMRHASLYSAPFRIRHRPSGELEPAYGRELDQHAALAPGGPLYDQGPGGISRWMALPWQGDTAFCRSGYEKDYDPHLPTFWPARVPNQVLTKEDYDRVMDETLSREDRLAAFNQRADWLRAIMKGSVADVMKRMIKEFGAMGVVEARPGPKDDPDFPALIFVESLEASRLKAAAAEAASFAAAPSRPLTRAELAGWESEEQYEAFRNIRVRPR